MNLLIDTNILVPLEPLSSRDFAEMTPVAAQLLRCAQDVRSRIFIHPIIEDDISHDSNAERRQLRLRLLHKYAPLPAPPAVESVAAHGVDIPRRNTNDWIDTHLLAAVLGDACDFLVTEDRRLHARAHRAGVGSRVLFAQDAVEFLRTLAGQGPSLLPSVAEQYLHELDVRDTFFDSLRKDYPEFDEWFARCAREHRKAHVVTCSETGRLAAIAVLKEESHEPNGREARVLKLCTLKVSPDFGGQRYGELLVRSVVEHARKTGIEVMYFTAFPKHEALLAFADSFGFALSAALTARGEHTCTKSLTYTAHDEEALPADEFARRFGPGAISFRNCRTYLVPVEPRYHTRLWPETANQLELFNPEPCGNSIKKAYLCHSPTRTVGPGDVLAFYRTHNKQGVYTLGTVDRTIVSSTPSEVVRFVSTRTVYSQEQIALLCQRNVLALLFRHALTLSRPLGPSKLIEGGCMRRPPQSITCLKEGGVEWLRQQIDGS